MERTLAESLTFEWDEGKNKINQKKLNMPFLIQKELSQKILNIVNTKIDIIALGKSMNM